MRLNYYSDSTKTKKVVTIPSNLKMGYNYSTDGSNLILELKPAYTDSSYWWKNRLYAYNLNNGNLTAITEANDNYSYATMKISDGKLLYYFSDHSGGPGTETSKYYLYDFGSAQATEVPVDATANSIWDFNNGYLALSSFHGESQADIKLFNVNTSGTTTVLDGYTYKNPPRVQPGELNMSIGDGKLVWSDSVDIYVYTIATGKTEKITESSPEGSYKVMPKVEAGVVVWQEYKLGGALGAIQPKTLLASLLNPTAYAASGNAVVAYRLSSSSLIGRYATNSDGTSINSGIFGDTLYYDDTTATGYKSIYYVNLANATTLTALPNTGIATVVYLVVLSSVGYFLLRSKSIYNKLSKALIRK
jgi:hypothetical protein